MHPARSLAYYLDKSDISIDPRDPLAQESDYHYEGKCHQTSRLVSLPRTTLAKAIAHGLMQELASDPAFEQEGKMYGVLFASNKAGEQVVLKAFSGLLQGQENVPGWAPYLPGRERFALEEARTLEQLDALKQELKRLHELPIREALQQQEAQCKAERDAMSALHKQNKAQRIQQREHIETTLTGEACEQALRGLSAQSQDESFARRQLKRQWDTQLAELRQAVQTADNEMAAIRKQRKTISRTLQNQIHLAYEMMNFSGQVISLNKLFEDGKLPTGTGSCCAPKLLHYAAKHKLVPHSMAEFWWGPPPPNQTRQHKQFYGACAERCQPIMGFMLSGLRELPPLHPVPSDFQLDIIYEDDDLLAINKPSGLASVPGRTIQLHDSVVSRARLIRPTLPEQLIIHRLDVDTSGILLLSKNVETTVAMHQAFRRKQIEKEYVALLEAMPDKPLPPSEGTLDLPLAPLDNDKPKHHVDFEHGKPSRTTYRIEHHDDTGIRIRLFPQTGRTHQLRVHAASPHGLGRPIQGDSLYHPHPTGRLCLHAASISFIHPRTKQPLTLTTDVPF